MGILLQESYISILRNIEKLKVDRIEWMLGILFLFILLYVYIFFYFFPYILYML